MSGGSRKKCNMTSDDFFGQLQDSDNHWEPDLFMLFVLFRLFIIYIYPRIYLWIAWIDFWISIGFSWIRTDFDDSLDVDFNGFLWISLFAARRPVLTIPLTNH